MATYSELMAQAQLIMAQAEQARKDQLSHVIASIKNQMKEYGITIEDLGGFTSGKKTAKSKSRLPAKYRGPNGELWAGGPGRKPDWVRNILADNKKIEDYLI